MAHGGGGKRTQQLIERIFLPAFGNPLLNLRHDGAVIQSPLRKAAFTTDSYVVNPLFFPGGDIGTLAINGTVNDLAMCGARPLYISAGFILEEGLPMESLSRIVQSMASTAKEIGVQIVTGDTKVVDRGKGDGIFINTSGIGVIEHDWEISPLSVQEGDAVILSGDIGRHGIAVMAVREGLEFETTIQSDCASLWGIVKSLLDSGIKVHCLRDLTRGGLSSALVEIAQSSRLGIEIDEAAIPLMDEVRAACEILGLDPMFIANEGRFICFIPSSEAEKALEQLRTHLLGYQASIIGQVTNCSDNPVTMRTQIGTKRVVEMLSGEQLPRIC